jgi:dihydrofolate synthase/folylpolyglutamate synthase
LDRQSVSPNSARILDRLKGLHPRLIDLSLGRIERLLAALGHPERALPPVVHVAGTNGKGSVIACLRAMLTAHGRSVHVYTSPHLVRFHERIVIAGREVDEAELAAALEACERANAGAPITFFEITTAAALLLFQRVPAANTLLETGLGGRLDATNVVAGPALTVLTSISLDHQSYLGDTLARIAAEKAGILKTGVPALCVRQHPEAMAVIMAQAKAVGAPLLIEGTDWSAREDGGRLLFQDPVRSFHLPLPALPGRHQIGNAGVAVAALLRLLPEMQADRAAMARGLAATVWRARLERLTAGRRLPRHLPDGWELWLDGGHNPGAGEALALHINGCWRDRPLFLVVGMLRTKDPAGFLRPLQPLVERMIALAIPGEANTLTALETAAAGASVGMMAEPAADLDQALTRLAGSCREPARVLICGSLYLAGVVLRENEP